MTPTNIGIGSTWDPELYSEAYAQVAAEIRARGGHLGLVSTLDILRDPRWGRSEECYSEDPYLSARMTAAAVKGLQGDSPKDLGRSDKIAAVLKHFCAQGASTGGRNAGASNIGPREVREIHLPAMQSGVKAGAMGCMAAYNEIDGIPCNANTELLTDVLRGEWGFSGIVMADGCALDMLVTQAGDHEAAAALAVKAGVDLSLWDKAFTTLDEAVKHGKVSEEYIDRAVRRVLRLKFAMGLFDNPYTDRGLAVGIFKTGSSRELNLRLTREAVVLLKNDQNVLPIGSNIRKIAVIGPNADEFYNQLGDYTPTQRNNAGMTVLGGIRNLAATGVEVRYARGCGIRDTAKDGFPAAIEAAKNADIVVLVLGGCSTRDFSMQFDVNGAAMYNGNPTDMDCGEGVDLSDLELGGVQLELAQAIAETGTPTVAVLIQGRPHAVPWLAENCAALLSAWYPGQQGGTAVAEILLGKVNPSGKLPVSVPRSSGQLPVYYNAKGRASYRDQSGEPLFPFGYGLSYTSFEYSNLRAVSSELPVQVTVDITNTGDIAGAEVAQLYIRDLEASVTRRVKELKGFKRVWLEPRETKTVTFELRIDELGIWDDKMEFVIEPGNICIMVGGSSKTVLETVIRLN